MPITDTITKEELTALVRTARDFQQGKADYYDSKATANASTVELADLAKGRAEAFESVLHALERNERYGLRVFGCGHIGVKGD